MTLIVSSKTIELNHNSLSSPHTLIPTPLHSPLNHHPHHPTHLLTSTITPTHLHHSLTHSPSPLTPHTSISWYGGVGGGGEWGGGVGAGGEWEGGVWGAVVSGEECGIEVGMWEECGIEVVCGRSVR